MTTISAPRFSHSRVSPTRFERALLRVTAAVESFVASRLERRAMTAARAAGVAQERYVEARRRAEALGATGTLPR